MNDDQRTAGSKTELNLAQLSSVFEQAPAAIAVFSGPQHIVDLVNPKYCELCGRKREALVGKPVIEGYPELAGSRVFEIIESVFASGETAHYPEFEIAWDRDATGQLVTACFDWTCQPMRDADGAISGTVQFFFDVTERVLARANADVARWEAERASRAKDDVLSVLGHELRNPLSPIRTALHLMNMRGVRSREQAVIERQVNELVKLADELLDVARTVQGRTAHRLHSVAPPPPSNAELELLTHSAFGKGKRVLIVEDNEDAAEILGALLKRMHFTVDIAHDGEEALAIAREFQPEIALLDIGLPNISGYDLAERLRAIIDDPDNLKLIAITGYDEVDDFERSVAVGFRAHLVKPLDPQQLTQLLAALC